MFEDFVNNREVCKIFNLEKSHPTVHISDMHYISSYTLHFQTLGSVLMVLTTALIYVWNWMEDTSVTVQMAII